MSKRSAADEIPEATAPRARTHAHDAPAHDARADAPPRARTRARAHASGNGKVRELQRPAPGPATRAAGDQAQADSIARLAQSLHPGVGVRIERTQPRWAAGYLEDTALEDGDVAELYEYVRDEYGGRVYRITVTTPGGAPVYTAKLPVAGPVKHNGRVVSRREWEGEDDDPPPTRRPAGADAGAFGGIAEMLGMVLSSHREANQAQTEAMRAAMESNTKQTQRLMELVVEDRASAAKQESLAGQLEGLVQAQRAVRKVGKLFGASADTPAADDGGILQGATREAMQHFMGNVLASEFGPKPAPAERSHGRPRRPSPPSRGRVNPITPDQIPEAKPRR